MQAPLPLAAGELGGECVEVLIPSAAKPLEPPVDVLQRRGLDCVEPSGARGADPREPVLPQHAQMLRDPGLGKAELPLHDGRDLPGRQLSVGEQFKDPPPDGIAQDFERVHGAIVGPQNI